MTPMQSKVTGSGALLVLVPGGLTGWVSWEPHEARLSATRKVVRVQLLSVQYGLEDRALGPDYSVKTESKALTATLDRLGLKQPIDIAAWSFGALVTLDFALDSPQRVRSLTLIEPPAFWLLRDKGQIDQEAEDVMGTLASIKDGEISEDDLEKFMCAVGLCPPGAPVRQLPQWPNWVKFRRSLRNTPAVLRHKDRAARLKSIKCPVLLVKGVGSARFLRQVIDLLGKELPQAEVIELPAGHAPHIVSMDRFLEKLNNHLARVGRPAAR